MIVCLKEQKHKMSRRPIIRHEKKKRPGKTCPIKWADYTQMWSFIYMESHNLQCPGKTWYIKRFSAQIRLRMDADVYLGRVFFLSKFQYKRQEVVEIHNLQHPSKPWHIERFLAQIWLGMDVDVHFFFNMFQYKRQGIVESHNLQHPCKTRHMEKFLAQIRLCMDVDVYLGRAF